MKSKITCRIATTRQDKALASYLVEKKYAAQGFGDQVDLTEDGLETVIAVTSHGLVVGTVSKVVDRGPGSLPTESSFPDRKICAIMDRLRSDGRCLLEITRLAAVGGINMGLELSRAALHWCLQDKEYDACIISVGQHHVSMYVRNLLFQPIAGPCWSEAHQAYDSVLLLDLRDQAAYWQQLKLRNAKACRFYQDTSRLEFLPAASVQ